MRRCLPLLLLLACAVPAAGKSLSWSAFDVTARLEADGKLRVRERQTIVFDGDWNGGERLFHLRQGESLEVQGMARDGAPMQQGDLDLVDRWQLDGTRLRWRSRLPNDPPFENRPIVYDIDYTLASILEDQGDGTYVLDNDFAFPKREGNIRKFSLQLDFDPAWRDVSQVVLTRGVLAPGESVVVRRTMRFAGSGKPLSRPAPLSKSMGGLLAAAIITALVFVFLIWYRGEQHVGRFAPLLPSSQIDDAWLQEHVFALKPEVAGAAWDDSVGAPEVAAVLARMAQEKKIATRAERKVLHMNLLVDRDSLDGYEKELIRKLFVNKATETDTDQVKKHYQGRGFNPGEVIEKGLKPDLDRLPGWKQKEPRARVARAVWLFLIAIALLTIAAVTSELSRPFVFVWSFLSVFLLVFGGIVAVVNAKAIGPSAWRAGLVALFCLPVTLGAVFTALNAGNWDLPVITPIALGALALASWTALLEALRIADGAEKIAFRRRLASARQYFVEQLRSPHPNLRDDWFPYLLAFGLGNNVDGWFRAHGSASSSVSSSSWSSSSGSSSSSSSGWTGGGGAFGGAGATGGWATAAGALAAGVSAPSSSGSGGGGGGGGGSSGGGGGGGW
ncbi:MAG TPA: hypothetical protein VGR02_14050 [Thermoanaerobaculia bacterium]|jgi:uncharacterized membrane protein YgcG|nr:hypothetical protein [Thermoanaerobaculia bacterium]